VAAGFVSLVGGYGHSLGLKAHYGDLNCDGTVDFADINPFVLYLSNFAGWQATFPRCHALNGDINGDGTYGQSSLGDINPFIELLIGGG
jgi:hypothetical protein